MESLNLSRSRKRRYIAKTILTINESGQEVHVQYRSRKTKYTGIEQLDKATGEVINVHETAQAAALALNKPRGYSSRILSAIRDEQSAYGFKWRAKCAG